MNEFSLFLVLTLAFAPLGIWASGVAWLHRAGGQLIPGMHVETALMLLAQYAIPRTDIQRMSFAWHIMRGYAGFHLGRRTVFHSGFYTVHEDGSYVATRRLVAAVLLSPAVWAFIFCRWTGRPFVVYRPDIGKRCDWTPVVRCEG